MLVAFNYISKNEDMGRLDRAGERVTIEDVKPEDTRDTLEVQKRGWLRTFPFDGRVGGKHYRITADDINDHFDAKMTDEYIQRYAADISDPNKIRMFVARAGGKVVGYAAIYKFRDQRMNNPSAIFVDEEYEGHGARLIFKLLNEFKKTFPGEDMESDVVAYNDHAWQIYERLQFHKVGEPYERMLQTRRGPVPQPMVKIVRKAETF